MTSPFAPIFESPNTRKNKRDYAAPLINMGRNILFLVAGKNKDAIVEKVLYSTYEPHKYPAQLIQPINGMLYWYINP